jgi:peptidoglycan hydrolase-like protein with peptidoglycan-binding domain
MASYSQNIKVTSASRYAEQQAKKLGLTLTSAWRSPAKDRAVGGTGTGYHTLGQAYDLAGSWRAMDMFAKACKESGLFRSVLWQVAGHYDHVHVSWHATGTSYTPPSDGIVENGNKGGLVETIQKLLGGIKVDGYFGKNTEKAVKEFQKSHGDLAVDGIVGENTWESLTKGGGSFFY